MSRGVLNRIRLWIRANVLRRRLEREMREEMAEHLERSVERLMARGLGREEARRQATREFGNVTWLREEARYARGTLWLDALIADARFALRQFARKPVTTLVMFVVLAVGMSLSALLFSYVHSYAVQPPVGIPLDDDLVRIRGSRDAGVYGRALRTFSEDEFQEYRSLTGPFDAVAGWTFGSVILDAGGGGRSGVEARATFVTGNYFGVLGVRPVIGPGWTADTTGYGGEATVAVIGHTAWEQLFGGSPAVIGSTVAVNGVPLTIVGVAPERFNGVGGHVRFQVWVPLEARRLIMPASDAEFRAVARLRPGVGIEEATAAAAVVAERSAPVEEGGLRDASADVVPLLSANGDPMFDRDVRIMSLLVGLLGLLVLAVTCTNVSALLTGLASARRHEIAVRLSLGASRWRIIRQLLTESAVLAVVAAVAALGIVWLALRAATVLLPFLPMELGVTWTVTSFTFGIALAVGIVFGLSPALHATRLAIATAIRDSVGTIATTRARLQRGLVVAQIAFTQPLIVLLAAVLLLILGNYRPQTPTPFGDRLVTVSLRPASPVTVASPEDDGSRVETLAGTRRLIHRLEATAGIEAAVMEWPGSRSLGAYAAAPEDRATGRGYETASLVAERASAGYFRARGLPLVRGREFRPNDSDARDAGATAAIIDTDLARRLWPDADPLGRRLRPVSDSAGQAATLVVVGVTDGPAARARDAGDDFRIWLPAEPDRASPSLLIRTTGDAAPLLPAIRRVAREELPDMAARARTIAETEALNTRRFFIVLAGIVGAGFMALLLSAIGLYAVVAFSVAVRRREIAVRMAVGAAGRQIVRKFLADGLRMSALGLALGLPVSLVGLRVLITATGEEFPTVTLPPVTAIAAFGVLVVAAAAVWIPARRAAAIDPAVTLRSD